MILLITGMGIGFLLGMGLDALLVWRVFAVELVVEQG